MAATGVDDSSLANVIQDTTIPDSFPSLNPRPNLAGLDQSYSTANQWYAYLPLENVLGKRYNNLELHLRQFSVPQIEMGSMTASFKGYEKEMPTKVLNAGTKQLTLSYLVDEYWQNYKSLWAWTQSPDGTLNKVTDDKASGVSPSSYITMRIYLLNNYKKKVVQFEFENVWIKIFNELQLDVTNQDVIEHSFTICYDDMRMLETNFIGK